ncbi:MAG: PD-(D/E)XK nuclease family protein [Flavobacteriales bacterium]|nr:PD-(D/E)XK nuclease family protein [Flavobacteriales bacterium]
MARFLKQLADTLLARHRDELEHVAVVLPGRRAGLYLRKYLAEASGTALWSPEIMDPGEFLLRIAGLREADPIEILVLLHRAHCDLSGADAESLAEFLRWAPTTLRDMSEIDAHLLDLDDVYRDLLAYHELDDWSFLASKELSPSQRSAREQWVRLGQLHRRMNELMTERGIGTSGSIARLAAERAANADLQLPWRHVWAAGLNALEPAAVATFRSLSGKGLANFAWDVDSYYLADQEHEAGKFVRPSMHVLGAGSIPVRNDILEHQREIDVVTVAHDMAAVHVAAAWIKDLTDAQRKDAVLILADENLILPLLNALPEDSGTVNVTMGIRLDTLPVHGLVERFLQLAIVARGMGAVPLRELASLVMHPLLNRGAATDSVVEILNGITDASISIPRLEQFLSDASIDDRGHIMNVVQAALHEEPSLGVQAVIAWAASVQRGDRLGTEQLYQLAKAEQELSRSLVVNGRNSVDPATYAAIRERALRGRRLALFGEPLAGLQIMGLLETRALDHAHVFILGANEGVLGGSEPPQSWIPFELRRHYHLPLRADGEAITSYHVHRLLHCAERVCLVHSTGADGSAAPTRFIAQWEHDLVPIGHTVIGHRSLHVPPSDRRSPSISVRKSDPVVERLDVLRKKGLSPSAIGTWLQCPLDFYFKYVLGLKDTNKQTTELGSDVLGSAVHAVLERAYKPALGKVLRAEDLLAASSRIKAELLLELSKEIPPSMLRTGDHHLRMGMATDALNRYLRTEAVRVDQEVSVPVGLEKVLNGVLPDGTCINGKCDRMETRNGVLHLLDLKTGSVRQADLKLAELDRGSIQRKHRYALQLLMYAYMVFQENADLRSLRTGIIPLRTPSGSSGIWLTVEGSNLLLREQLDRIGEVIQQLVAEIMDPATAFQHDPESEWCTYCVP